MALFNIPTLTKMRLNGLLTDYTNTAEITNRQRVSLSLAASGSNTFLVLKKLYFLTGYNLNRQTITGITIDTASPELSLDPTNGKFIPTYDDLSRGYLVLVDQQNKELATLPLTDFVNSINGGKTFRCNFSNLNIGACYVRFFANSSLDSTYSLPLTFCYK
jgi:hypothetical protein